MKASHGRICFAALLGVLLAACAARSAMEPAPASTDAASTEEAELATAWQELQAHKAELASHRGVGDCKEVCNLSALICSAGERVCGIAGRHPQVTDYRGRCQAAEEDCRSARSECESCR